MSTRQAISAFFRDLAQADVAAFDVIFLGVSKVITNLDRATSAATSPPRAESGLREQLGAWLLEVVAG